ncbi:tail fiber assembly protein [Xenorhabdus sp. ZM]|uniref:tail fiber assembly protein n=1 Tax=Xenorhabdus szentirmaii TaxID=290112 RepID=UPI00199955CC|nr:tail fiber assembly protein [Xenorhabdus sp. ZM]MBD2803511.1 tail fiber assembly protein [Xenorhabdus sp. ZM]
MKYTTVINTPKFDENGFATSAGWIKVYRADTTSGEYLGADMEYTYPKFSLSAGAYLDAPELPKSADIAVCRSPDGKSWIHLPDYRGKMGYHTRTRVPQNIQQFGALPSELTLSKPQTEFDVWKGQQWVTDVAAQRQYAIRQAEQEKFHLQQHADAMIKPLSDAVDLDMATKTEKAALLGWKKYRVLLNRVDCSAAPDIQWPEQPK